MKNKFGFLLAVIFIAATSGCASAQEATGDRSSPGLQATGKQAAPGREAPEKPSGGRKRQGTFTVKTAGMASADIDTGGMVAVMTVKEVPAPDYPKPSEGMRFVAFDILIDNTQGSETIQLLGNNDSFTVKDSEGYSYDKPNRNDLAKPAMYLSAEIEPGDVLRGWVTFEIRQEEPLRNLRLRLDAYKGGKSGWIAISQVAR